MLHIRSKQGGTEASGASGATSPTSRLVSICHGTNKLSATGGCESRCSGRRVIFVPLLFAFVVLVGLVLVVVVVVVFVVVVVVIVLIILIVSSSFCTCSCWFCWTRTPPKTDVEHVWNMKMESWRNMCLTIRAMVVYCQQLSQVHCKFKNKPSKGGDLPRPATRSKKLLKSYVDRLG